MTIEIPGGIWSLEESVEESAKKEAEKAYKATVKSSSGKLASKIVKFGRIILPSPVEVALDGTVSSEQFIDKEARNCSLYSDRFPSIFDKSPFMLDESGSVYFFSRRCWGCQGIAKQIKGYLDRTDGTSVKGKRTILLLGESTGSVTKEVIQKQWGEDCGYPYGSGDCSRPVVSLVRDLYEKFSVRDVKLLH